MAAYSEKGILCEAVPGSKIAGATARKKKTAWTDSLAQANHTDVPGSMTKVHEIHPVVTTFPSVYFSDKKNRGYT